MTKQHIIVFDIDGTLALNEHRQHYLLESPKNWDAFFEACDKDELNTPVAKMYFACTICGFPIKVVSGRSESVRTKTLEWFNKHQLQLKSEDLYMRKIGDYRPDSIIKPELVFDFINQIEIIFDDRNSVVNKWRELGLTCFQVADASF